MHQRRPWKDMIKNFAELLAAAAFIDLLLIVAALTLLAGVFAGVWLIISILSLFGIV